jgi:NitT/TauT family transport system substrate-binding protein
MKNRGLMAGWFFLWFLSISLHWGEIPPLLAQTGDAVRVVLPHRVLFDISLPIYVAEEKGFYEKAGIKVSTIFARGGGDQVQILVAGDGDISIGTGLLATLSALEKGAPLKIVSAEFTGMGDLFWYVKGDSPIKTIDHLAGKKVGFSNPGASTHMGALAMAEWLKSKGLAEPQLLPAGSPPEQFTAVMTGQIDAGWSVPPFFLEEANKGNIRILLRGAELPGLSDITIRVNLARSDFLRKRPEAMKSFLAATKKALDLIFSNPDEGLKIWIKNAKIKESPEVVKEAWKFYLPKSMVLTPIVGIDRSLSDAVKFKFVKKPFTREDLNRAIDLSYVPK